MIVAVPILVRRLPRFVAVNTAGFEAPHARGRGGHSRPGDRLLQLRRKEPYRFCDQAAVGFLWYLVGAGGDRPVANIGVTMLGIGWVGLFGAFAGLLLAGPHGVALLLAAVIPTIGYDVGALFVGRSAGSRPLSPASPSDDRGLAGGGHLAVVTAVLFSVIAGR
jgi:hypothetical protein